MRIKNQVIHLNFGVAATFQMYRNTKKDNHRDKREVLNFYKKNSQKQK